MAIGEKVESAATRITNTTSNRTESDVLTYANADTKLGEPANAILHCKAPKVDDTPSSVHIIARRAGLKTRSDALSAACKITVWADRKYGVC